MDYSPWGCRESEATWCTHTQHTDAFQRIYISSSVRGKHRAKIVTHLIYSTIFLSQSVIVLSNIILNNQILMRTESLLVKDPMHVY